MKSACQVSAGRMENLIRQKEDRDCFANSTRQVWGKDNGENRSRRSGDVGHADGRRRRRGGKASA